MVIFLNFVFNNNLSKHKSHYAFRVKFKIIIMASHDLSLPDSLSFFFFSHKPLWLSFYGTPFNLAQWFSTSTPAFFFFFLMTDTL